MGPFLQDNLIIVVFWLVVLCAAATPIKVKHMSITHTHTHAHTHNVHKHADKKEESHNKLNLYHTHARKVSMQQAIDFLSA